MMTIERALLAALMLSACTQQTAPAQAQPQPLDGSLFAAQPDRQWRLPPQLREISGLALSPDGRLFGHDDERAVIYEIDAAEGRLVKTFALGNPAERGDFEGLAITPAGEFWMTTSQGLLYRFREGADGAQAAFERFDTGLRQVCEIEGLAYLAAEESLILACKRHEARDMRDAISLYAWRPGGARAEPWRQLSEAAISNAAGVGRFRPSSLEIDTRSGRLLLLSARDGALAELAANGEILSARALGARHVQAEGVAILADGSLALTDEGGDGRALLSVYTRTTP